MEKDRTRRYETANGLAADVKRYLGDEPVVAAAPSLTYQLRKFTRRHKAAVQVATSFVLVLMICAVISVWYAVDARKAQRVSKMEVQNARDAELEEAR